MTIQIPDEIAARMTEGGTDLPRRALEAFALEELRAGRISEAQLGEMLGLHRMERDGFLKEHGVYGGYTLEEIEGQIATLQRFGR